MKYLLLFTLSLFSFVSLSGQLGGIPKNQPLPPASSNCNCGGSGGYLNNPLCYPNYTSQCPYPYGCYNCNESNATNNSTNSPRTIGEKLQNIFRNARNFLLEIIKYSKELVGN